MRKIRSILLALAMVLTLLPVSAFAVGTDRTEDLAALEEQMRQELFSADDRIYAEDYEAPEAPELRIDTTTMSSEEAAEAIVERVVGVWSPDL